MLSALEPYDMSSILNSSHLKLARQDFMKRRDISYTRERVLIINLIKRIETTLHQESNTYYDENDWNCLQQLLKIDSFEFDVKDPGLACEENQTWIDDWSQTWTKKRKLSNDVWDGKLLLV